MHRRTLLAALGTSGAASTTGCLGSSIFNTPCDPGDRALGPLYDSVLGGSNPGTVSVRGTIVSVSGSELVIADGTGFAAIEAQFGTEFNTDLLETGDCIEVTSAVVASFSREYGHLSVGWMKKTSSKRSGRLTIRLKGPRKSPISPSMSSSSTVA